MKNHAVFNGMKTFPESAGVHTSGRKGSFSPTKIFTSLLACAVLGITSLSAQTVVSVGSNSGTGSSYPIAAATAYSYSQQLYTTTQISQSGSITKIAFYQNTANPSNPANSNAWTIYMGTTTATTIPTSFFPLTDLTEVFSGTVTLNSAAGWLEVTLDTPFPYANTENLIIAVNETKAGSGALTYFRIFDTTTGRARTRQGSSLIDPQAPGSATYSHTYNNILQLTFETCITPLQPGTLNGSTDVCEGDILNYSVVADPQANDYTWSLPPGWTGSSTANHITVTVGSGGGTLSVTANSNCSSSPAQTLSVSVNNVPAQPSVITGSPLLCEGVMGAYSVTSDPDADDYTWVLPSGLTGSSTTNSINVVAGSSGGTISVTANNSCGSSMAQTFVVSVGAALAQPSVINGATTLCEGATETYSVTNDPSASDYTWTLPSGLTGSSTTNSISVMAGSSGGTITVTANNACGSSTSQTLTVSIGAALAQPSAINGATTLCEGATETYSVTNDPSASDYTWTLPSGLTGSSTTNSISVMAGSSGGTITVIANNACGSSTAQTLTLNVTPLPDNAVTQTGVTLTAQANGATYQWIDCNNGNTAIPGATAQSYTATANGSYAVIVTQNGCDATSSCFTVNSVGIAENERIGTLSVFPNPGEGMVNLTFSDKLNQGHLTVYNLSGQVVYTRENLSGTAIQVDLSVAEPGIYFLEVRENNRISRAKWVKH